MQEQNQQQTLPPQQPPISPQNANPVPPPQHENWIKWVLIIVFVVLLASITTYFVLTFQSQKPPPPQIVQTTPSPTPTPYPTANWKTYKTVIYQISYPPDLYKISDIEGRSPSSTFTYFISINDTNQENSLQDVLPFTISVSKTDKNMPINNPKDLFGNYGSITYDADYFLKDKTPQSYLLGGVSGYVIYNIAAGVSGIDRDIIVIKSNNLYGIQTSYGGGYIKDIEKYEKLIDQILSTFKFTN